MTSLMGFKRVDGVPKVYSTRSNSSIYKPLLNKVVRSGNTYALDVNDKKRAASLASTIRSTARKLGHDVVVCTRGTAVYVSPNDEEKED